VRDTRAGAGCASSMLAPRRNVEDVRACCPSDARFEDGTLMPALVVVYAMPVGIVVITVCSEVTNVERLLALKTLGVCYS
jgi:hypothetical protein